MEAIAATQGHWEKAEGGKMAGKVNARELLKHLVITQKYDLPVIVVNDDQLGGRYQPVQGITVLHNGCLVLHVGSGSQAENKKVLKPVG
jgi:hypothetical protein